MSLKQRKIKFEPRIKLHHNICHQIELGTNNLIFTLQTFYFFEASCLAMDALCNFHGNQDICQPAIKLCAKLCLNPFTPKISLVIILLTVCHIVLVMLV